MYNFLGPAPVFLVVRYLEDGTLDYEFGSNGLAKINLQADATFAELNDLEIQKDGRIIVGGTSALNGIQKRITIGRFTQTGLPDQSFGKNGYVITPIEEKESQVNGLLIQSDGKILGGGSVFERAAADGNFILLRYKDNGTLDSTFGDNGITIIEINGDARSIGIEFDQDAQILIAGNTYVTELPGNLVALARYNNDKPEKNKYLRIKHWLHHHGITWEDKPNNLINYYSIQSSTNGNVFSEVARIFSNHHGGIQTYTAANNATANYRVAAVSNTGNITYSNTLTLTATPTIQLYPNPAKNILQIQGLPAGTTKLMVTDISGNTRLIATANSTVYSIHIAQLTSGNYLLHIKTANEVITKQFIKE
jgi:uncharacterized delta-60 repeat protein